MSASIKVTLPDGKTVTHDFTGHEGGSLYDSRVVPVEFWESVADTAGLVGSGISYGFDKMVTTRKGEDTFIVTGTCFVQRGIITDGGVQNFVRGPSVDCIVETVTTYEAF